MQGSYSRYIIFILAKFFQVKYIHFLFGIISEHQDALATAYQHQTTAQLTQPYQTRPITQTAALQCSRRLSFGVAPISQLVGPIPRRVAFSPTIKLFLTGSQQREVLHSTADYHQETQQETLKAKEILTGHIPGISQITNKFNSFTTIRLHLSKPIKIKYTLKRSFDKIS